MSDGDLCKDRGGRVRPDGSCIACDAAAGQQCMHPTNPAKPERIQKLRAELAQAATLFLALGIDITPPEREALQRIAAMGDVKKSELWLRARAVVDARFRKDGSWEELKDAIASLAGLVGGGDLEHG